MTVYVDDMRLRARVGRLDARWSHLFVGPFDDPEELHAFAARIGLRRRWYQGPPHHRWPRCHYDVTDSRRVAAIAAGAVEVAYGSASGRRTLRAVEAMRQARATLVAGSEPDEAEVWALAKQLYEAATAAAQAGSGGPTPRPEGRPDAGSRQSSLFASSGQEAS
jgi:hypothetical protein